MRYFGIFTVKIVEMAQIAKKKRRAPLDAEIDHRRFTRPVIRFLKANIARFHFAAGGAFI